MESEEQMAMNLNTIKSTEFRKLFFCISSAWILIMSTLFFIIGSGLNFFIYGAALLYMLMVLALYFILDTHFNRIRNITLKIEQISRGSYEDMIENQREEDIDVLEFQIYQMSRRVQARLEQANKDKLLIKGTLSGLSHQFKTPITVMRTFNDLLLEGAIEDVAVAMEFVAKSAVQLDKLERLVHMILKLSRIEAGITLLSKSENVINFTLQEIICSLKEKAHKKQHTVTLEKMADAKPAFYDNEWLFEAIYNIVDNAIEYTPQGGKILIHTERSETHLKIEVEDNGEGIAKDDIYHVFETFYQGETAKKQNIHSTGIGLALSKLIVEKHSGIIKIHSSKGVGTKVTILLPI